MPSLTEEDIITRDYMAGIANFVINSQRDPVEITKLFTFLDEKDRRRNTNWIEHFPWLERYKQYVV
jgi:hypothetical protein